MMARRSIDLGPSLADTLDPVESALQLVQPAMERVTRTLVEIAREEDPVLGPMLSTVLPGSGKRLRPLLALLIGRAGGAEPGALNQMAVGVELLHTASLVHDDVVDASDTRRGSATLFTRVGNALAVLVGDYLFSQAAQACVATGNLDVVRLFAETLGAMAQGQIDEANAQRRGQTWRKVTRNEYFRTIWGKTASLFVLACEGTARLCNQPAPIVRALHTYGEKLGLAFQVMDDILDFTSTEEVLGKPVGGDLRQGTITLPVILLRDDGAAAEARAFLDAVDRGDTETQIALVQASTALEAARREAVALIDEARAALTVLPDGPERRALEQLAGYVVDRSR